MEYRGKKVAIAGYSVEGQSSLEYFQKRGAILTVLDDDPNISDIVPEGVAVRTGGAAFEDLEDFDLVVRTPGIHPSKLTTDKTTTQLREFLKDCPAKIIGVTGTKGKGTTSTLISQILEATGYKSWLVGNIGVAPLSIIEDVKKDDVVVYEMSSFQLIDADKSPNLAVILPVGVDHLDYHADREDYVIAKTNISAHQADSDISIFHSKDKTAKAIAATSAGRKIAYLSKEGADIVNEYIEIDGQKIIDINEVGLIGHHNLENSCAAVTACWQFTQDVNAIKKVLGAFTGLEHRIEFVAEIDGVKYYDDSFATTPESAIAALRSFEKPKVIILGGSKKESDFSELAKEILTANIRAVILIGKEGKTIGEAIRAAGVEETKIIDGGSTMTEIVEQARDAAKSGDTILLSPACASFDMFNSYKDRGEKFKQGVAGLAT